MGNFAAPPRQRPQCVPLVCEKFAENPEFRGGNFAANLKREISDTKSKCHDNPPARPAARGTGNATPEARSLGNHHGTGGIESFGNGPVEWGVVIATCVSVLSAVPGLCARSASFLHPKLRGMDAVLLARKLIPLPLRRPRRAASAPTRTSQDRSRHLHYTMARGGGPAEDTFSAATGVPYSRIASSRSGCMATLLMSPNGAN